MSVPLLNTGRRNSRPPPVVWQVKSAGLYARVLLALGLLVVTTAALFCAASVFSWRPAAMVLVAALAISFAVPSLRYPSLGTLSWTGKDWVWSAWRNQPLAQTQVIFSFPRLILLRLVSGGDAVCWLWLTPSTCPENWSALRRALVFVARRPVNVT